MVQFFLRLQTLIKTEIVPETKEKFMQRIHLAFDIGRNIYIFLILCALSKKPLLSLLTLPSCLQ